MGGLITVPVARRNLLSEKGRFAISAGGVGFAVLLILIVIALYRGWSQTGEVFLKLPGEIWVTQAGTSDPFHSTSLLTSADIDLAASVEGVGAAVPVLSRQMNIPIGDDEESVRFMALALPGGLQLSPDIEASYAPSPGNVVIEKTLSRKTGLKEGDRLLVHGVDLLVGEVRPQGGDVLSQFVFIHYSDAEQIFGVGDVVNYVMLIVSPGSSVDEVAAAVSEANGGVRVYTSTGFAEAVRKEIDEAFLPVISILVLIGFIVGAAVVGLTVYTATIERAREFGVMKAVGASGSFLYRIVLTQSVILTTVGFIVGLAAAVALARLAEQMVPEFVTDFRAWDVAGVLAATGLMSIIASLAPIRRINGIDPAMVFRA